MKKVFLTLLTFIVLLEQGFTQNVIITEINYNNPSTDDYEFIELYNRGNSAVALENWTFSVAVNYTFPAYTLNPGEYVVIAGNAAVFEAGFGFAPLGWNPANNNALNNTGENIVLSDANGVLVDSVHYVDAAPWPTSPDGLGPTLVLCDVNADNSNPANWAAATTPTGVFPGGTEILGNPGAASGCAIGPVIKFLNAGFVVQEDVGGVQVNVVISNGNANPTSVTLELNAASTATVGSDYTAVLPVTITFAGGVIAETQTVIINVIADAVVESVETLVLDLTNPTNGAEVDSNAAQFILNIQENGSLVITGVFDAQPGAAGAKGIELKALQDIADLSVYGMGSANNGGGSVGEEISFPPIVLNEGECVYIAADSALFLAYFGFNPLADGTGASINGDDAIELFENGLVIDVFGEVSYPGGSTLAWNHLDGWAYRKDGTGPDGSVFDLSHWTIIAGALNGGTNNDTAPVPFPVCDYSPIAPMTAEAIDDAFLVPFEVASNLNVLFNDILPTVITSINIVSGPINGTATVNGLIDITYTPDAGYCGPDEFTYQVCDAGGCDQATVNITVECQVTYPSYDIVDVTTVTNGQPDSAGVTCQLHGIVYGIDFQGVNASGQTLPAVQFYLNDGTGGISVFSAQNFGYVVEEGDEVVVRGKIVNFNCLSQISELDTIIFVSSNNPLLPPSITTFLNESFESELVEFTNMVLVDPSEWVPVNPGFNVHIRNIVNPNADTITMRIDNDCELFNMPAPSGTFHAIGIGGQFVQGGGVCIDGYQFLPRYAADIILLDATTETWLAGKISFYPNPVSDMLFIKTAVDVDEVTVSNTLGQVLLRLKNPSDRMDMGSLGTGLYLVTFRVEDASWTSKFVKE